MYFIYPSVCIMPAHSHPTYTYNSCDLNILWAETTYHKDLLELWDQLFPCVHSTIHCYSLTAGTFLPSQGLSFLSWLPLSHRPTTPLNHLPQKTNPSTSSTASHMCPPCAPPSQTGLSFRHVVSLVALLWESSSFSLPLNIYRQTQAHPPMCLAQEAPTSSAGELNRCVNRLSEPGPLPSTTSLEVG